MAKPTNEVMQEIIRQCLSCCKYCGRGTSGDHPECEPKEENNDNSKKK